MSLDFLNNYLTIIIFLAIALILSLGFLILNFAFSPKNPDPEKLSAYECGFEPFNDSRMEFDIRFYLVAILFIIFDLEIAFLFPWAISLGAIGAIWVIFEGNLGNLIAFRIGYGELLFFWGCVGHALYAILIPILNKGENAASQTLGTLSAGFLLLILIFTNDVLETNWLSLSPLTWIPIIYLATIATAITFVLSSPSTAF